MASKKEGLKLFRKESTMFCPKCKAKIGLYRFEGVTQSHFTQGMTCSVCGYWSESGVRARKRVKKTLPRLAKTGSD
jgi:hypothetical protein